MLCVVFVVVRYVSFLLVHVACFLWLCVVGCCLFVVDAAGCCLRFDVVVCFLCSLLVVVAMLMLLLCC